VPLRPHAILFDAYGTLFDVHSIVLLGDHGLTGDLPTLSVLWRRKQLESTWLLALMERYEDFWKVTGDALRASVRQLGIEATEVQLQRLMDAYLSPSPFPEVRSALGSLDPIPKAILSNGTPGMLESAIAHGGLTSRFAHIISVERVKTYKPSPLVYALGAEILQIPAAEILFVSSNGWDAAGAKAYGYQVCRCDRSATEVDSIGFAPDFTVSGLDQLALKIGFPP
jgi:2-haloacid dehalogenase